MATNNIAFCPGCGASLPEQPRFCPQCGRHLSTEETLEHPANTVAPDSATAPRPRPAEYSPTMHQVHRRPLGVHPVPLLGGLGGLALLVAVILLAAGAVLDGFVLLGLAVAVLTLFLVGLRREPDATAARQFRRAAERSRSLAVLATVTLRAWARAGVTLLRIRHRQRQLRGEFQDRLAPLGEAVYREDQQRAGALTRQAGKLNRELEEARREASSVIGDARREIERERATAEPTQSLPQVR